MRFLRLLLFTLALVLVGQFVSAQTEGGVAPIDWTGFATAAVNLVVPIIVWFVIAGMKKVLPLIPSWLIPLIAMALGYGVSWLTSYIAGGHVTALVGVLLGAVTVVANEVIKALNEKGLTGNASTPVLK